MTDNALRNLVLWCIAVSGAVTATYLLRISGALDLDSYAQDRNIGYIMDAAWRSNWVVQHDIQHRVTSKPPLHTWLAAALARTWGINRLTLTLPSFLAVLALSLVVLAAGRRAFGPAAGGFAGLAVALAPLVSKHVALVRTDPLFALAVAFTALAAWRAWHRGAGPGSADAISRVWDPSMSFWLAAAAATLIKGPLGVVLGAAGLLAFFWERRTDPTTPRPGGLRLTPMAVYLGLCLGWFLLAVHACGYELVDKMIVQELFGQATGVHKGAFPGRNLLKPAAYFLWRFLPFSVFAFIGLWRVMRSPAAGTAERRFERFLFCWIVVGLAIFSFAAHHRADLLLPLWPPGALLAGREIARLRRPLGEHVFAWLAVIAGIALMMNTYWTYHRMPARRAQAACYSERVRQVAEALKATGIDPMELVHIDTPVTLQVYLGTCKSWADIAEVQELLARGQPFLLATQHRRRHGDLLDALRDAHTEELCTWPQEHADEEGFRLTVLRVVPRT